MARQTQTIHIGLPSSRSATNVLFSYNWPNGPTINDGLRDPSSLTLIFTSILFNASSDTFAAVTFNLDRAFRVSGDFSRQFEAAGSVTFTNATAGAIKLDLSAGTASPYTFSDNTGALVTWMGSYATAPNSTIVMFLDDGDFKADLNPIAMEMATGTPSGQRLKIGTPFPASLTWDLGSRNRTRSGGSIWEWNDDDVALPPPFGDHPDIEKDRTRIGADRIQITDPDNDNLGFTDQFETTGSMTLWSPSAPLVGSITFEHPTFSASGRFTPTGHPDWSAWWTAFSANTSHELSIRFDIPGPVVELAAGRPEGQSSIVGEPMPIAMDFAVGRPRGFFPKLRAQPIALEAATGKPHAFAHAEFILLEQDVGRPLVKQFGRPGSAPPVDAIPERDWGDVGGAGSPYFSTWDFRPGSNAFNVSEVFPNISGVSGGGSNPQISGGILVRPAPAMPLAVGMVLTLSAHNGEIRLRHSPASFETGRESFTFRGTEVDAWVNAFWDEDGNPGSAVRFHLQFEVFRPFLALEADAGRPIAQVKRAVQPIAAESAVGRPGVSTTRAVQPIAFEAAVGRPEGQTRITGIGEPIALELSVGRPQPYGHGAGITLDMGLGRPRGYITKVAAHAIAIEEGLSRPHAFAHAEFIQTDMAVGRPRAQVKRAVQPLAMEQALGRPAAILFGEPGSTTAGTTTTESHNFGRYTLIRSDANSTWQFNANLTLPVPIMTASASPIVQAHVRANQVRFITTGGANPGFSDAFNTTGRLTLTRVGGSSFNIVGPNFDHLGRMDPSGLDGYSEWWSAFSAGGTLSQLEVTWELDSAGFVPFLAQEHAVGRPEGRTRLIADPMPLAQELAVSRPHAFAHAEFVQQDLAVGRPGVSTTRAVQPIALEASVGRPHAFAHAEFILLEQGVGRPRGYIPAVAAHAITQEMAVERPDGLKQRVAVGQPILLQQAVGRPRGYIPKVAAQGIAAEAVSGRPIALVRRAVEGIALEHVAGKPQVYSGGAEITLEQVTGRPRGYIPKVAAQGISLEQSTARPHAFAHAEFILLEQAVGRPRISTSRAARPIAQEGAVGRPHTLRAVEAIAQEAAVGRPGVSTSRATRPIAQEGAVGRPAPVVQGRPRPITMGMAVGRPVAQVKRAMLPIVLEDAVGRPAALVARTALPIVLETAVGKPHAFGHAASIVLGAGVGRPVAQVKRAMLPIAAQMATGRPQGFRNRIAHGMPVFLDNATGRPNAQVKRAVRPLAWNAVTGRARGYLPSVAARGITLASATARPHGERLRTTPAIPAVVACSVGRANGYIQIVARFSAFETATGRPQRYFPRRNPLAQATADARAEMVNTHATVQAVTATTRASQ